jgi:ABC-type glycerol-3-phosphate transport system substrate-binding protein
MLSWLDASGAEILSSNRQGYAFNTSQVSNVFSFLRKLYDDGCAWKPQTSQPAQEFAARKALFISIPLSGLPAVESAMTQAQNKDRWMILPYPSSQGKPALTASGPSWSITHSQPERQLAAWLLLRQLVAPDLQAAWAKAYSAWPAAASAEPLLASERANQPAWSGSFNLLPLARPEPSLGSWDAIRWVLSDASERLFSVTFHAEQIPLLVKMLDDTAKEIEGLNQ